MFFNTQIGTAVLNALDPLRAFRIDSYSCPLRSFRRPGKTRMPRMRAEWGLGCGKLSRTLTNIVSDSYFRNLLVLRPLEEQTAIWASPHVRSRSRGFSLFFLRTLPGSTRDLVAKAHLTHAAVPLPAKQSASVFVADLRLMPRAAAGASHPPQ